MEHPKSQQLKSMESEDAEQLCKQTLTAQWGIPKNTSNYVGFVCRLSKCLMTDADFKCNCSTQ